MAPGRKRRAKQGLFALEVPVDAEFGYLRPLSDLVQCRRLKPQFRKKFARGVEYGLTKRLVSGPAAPASTIFHHVNSSP